MKRLNIISRILAIVLALGLIGYLVFVNTVPFDIHKIYLASSPHISTIGPSSRVESTNGYTKQIDDLAYFTNDMPFAFDTAKITTQFRNHDVNQEVSLGYRNHESWGYASSILSAPFMDAIQLPRTGKGPYLYQKTPAYDSAQAFIKNPPKDKVIGIYDYDNTTLPKANTQPSNYVPSKTHTAIDVPLRGKTTMYVYVQNEPIELKLTKKDLNWYVDPDVTNVSMYKGKDKLISATIDDDGNASNDHKYGRTDVTEIRYPRSGNAEAGIYQIVIDAPSDSVITQISTNLHKFVFEGPIYPINSHEVYGDLVSKTLPTTLYASVLSLSALTNHAPSLQTISADALPLTLTKVGVEQTQKLISPVAMAIAPKSDVILNGPGYFAFSQDQFFEPTPYHILPITSSTDVAHADYILTNYRKPRDLGDGWQETTLDYDLSSAVIQKRQLSWLISAPGLSDSKGEFDIKSISMSLSKEGWWGK